MSLKGTCRDIETQIKEVRDKRKAENWKGLSKEKKRGAWRKHYERLLQAVEKSRVGRGEEIERMKVELRTSIQDLIKNDHEERA